MGHGWWSPDWYCTYQWLCSTLYGSIIPLLWYYIYHTVIGWGHNNQTLGVRGHGLTHWGWHKTCKMDDISLSAFSQYFLIEKYCIFTHNSLWNNSTVQWCIHGCLIEWSNHYRNWGQMGHEWNRKHVPNVIKHKLSHQCHQWCSKTCSLTHCDLVTSYGDRDLGQHWLR